jgi:hypothetical protein
MPHIDERWLEAFSVVRLCARVRVAEVCVVESSRWREQFRGRGNSFESVAGIVSIWSREQFRVGRGNSFESVAGTVSIWSREQVFNIPFCVCMRLYIAVVCVCMRLYIAFDMRLFAFVCVYICVCYMRYICGCILRFICVYICVLYAVLYAVIYAFLY